MMTFFANKFRPMTASQSGFTYHKSTKMYSPNTIDPFAKLILNKPAKTIQLALQPNFCDSHAHVEVLMGPDLVCGLQSLTDTLSTIDCARKNF